MGSRPSEVKCLKEHGTLGLGRNSVRLEHRMEEDEISKAERHWVMNLCHAREVVHCSEVHRSYTRDFAQ